MRFAHGEPDDSELLDAQLASMNLQTVACALKQIHQITKDLNLLSKVGNLTDLSPLDCLTDLSPLDHLTDLSPLELSIYQLASLTTCALT